MYADNAPRYSLRRQPTATVNFVTCHDGFTVNDLVSYDSKHNDANKENDGTDDNRSWNCGSGPADDGPSTDPGITALRRRQQRNFLATLLVSRGVPMLLAGDERNRTQQGNNSAYCQDNAISWMNWTADKLADNLTAVVRSLTSLRAEVRALRAHRFPEPGPDGASEPVADTGLTWFNPDGSPVTRQDWDNPEGRSFAVLFADTPPELSALIMFNAYWDPLPFTAPTAPSATWTVKMDTTQEDGTPTSPRLNAGTVITVGPRSVVIATG
jgi:isoamylase